MDELSELLSNPNLFRIKDDDFNLKNGENFKPSNLPLLAPVTTELKKKDIENSKSSIDFNSINNYLILLFCDPLQVKFENQEQVIFLTDGYYGTGLFQVQKTLLYHFDDPIQDPEFLWVALLQKIFIGIEMKKYSLSHYRQVLNLGETPTNPIPVFDNIFEQDTFINANDMPLFDPTCQIPLSSDILQKSIGCCYIDGTLMAIVDRLPQIIKQLFISESEEHVVVKLHQSNDRVVFYQLQKTIATDGNRPLQDHRFLWVHLLEKALAFHYRMERPGKTYNEILTGGNSTDVLKHCLGHNISIEYEYLTKDDKKSDDSIKLQLNKWLEKDNCIITTCSKDHVYSLKSLIERNNDEIFVVLANPHGHKDRNFFSGFETYTFKEFLDEFECVRCVHIDNAPAHEPIKNIKLYNNENLTRAYITAIARKLPQWGYVMPTERSRTIELVTTQLCQNPALKCINSDTSKQLQKELFLMLHKICYRKRTIAMFLPHNWQTNDQGRFYSYGMRIDILDENFINDFIKKNIELSSSINVHDDIPLEKIGPCQ